jgi:hydrogenase maturation protein HypF
MLRRGFNCPPTSSAGRWFDAAAAALGLSVRQSHEAEAAVALEERATQWLAAGHEPSSTEPVPAGADGVLDLGPRVATLFDTPADAIDAAAAGFHATLAASLVDWAAAAARRGAVGTVCLGGGCFFNALLSAGVTRGLQARGLRVLRPQRQSCGDASLALGQAWVAAWQLQAQGAVTALHGSLACV